MDIIFDNINLHAISYHFLGFGLTHASNGDTSSFPKTPPSCRDVIQFFVRALWVSTLSI